MKISDYAKQCLSPLALLSECDVKSNQEHKSLPNYYKFIELSNTIKIKMDKILIFNDFNSGIIQSLIQWNKDWFLYGENVILPQHKRPNGHSRIIHNHDVLLKEINVNSLDCIVYCPNFLKLEHEMLIISRLLKKNGNLILWFKNYVGNNYIIETFKDYFEKTIEMKSLQSTSKIDLEKIFLLKKFNGNFIKNLTTAQIDHELYDFQIKDWEECKKEHQLLCTYLGALKLNSMKEISHHFNKHIKCSSKLKNVALEFLKKNDLL